MLAATIHAERVEKSKAAAGPQHDRGLRGRQSCGVFGVAPFNVLPWVPEIE